MAEADNEILDSSNETVEEPVETDPIEETPSGDDAEDVGKLKEQNRKLFERAKKAEGFVLRDGHWVKKDPVVQPKPTNQVTAQSPQVSGEELRLMARGLSDEEIDEAKSIARGKDISLGEALKTTSFKLFQDNLKEEQKKEAAKLGASSGSNQTSEEGAIKPGMTPEEHRKAWEEAQGL